LTQAGEAVALRAVGRRLDRLEAELPRIEDAESVLLQLEQCIEDYNTRAPHSALGMRSPVAYRAEATQRSKSVQ
jgi:transposase InsO family protein